MLFKSLGYITSFGNIAVIFASYNNDTLQKIWTPHWNITLGSVIFLSIISIFLFYISDKRNGINALKIYGSVYTLLALIIYSYWSFKNLYLDISFSEFKGLFFLFSTLLLISLLSIVSYMKEGNGRLLLWISYILSVITVIITFATIYKYIFIQAPFHFDNLILELFNISIGSIMFIVTYSFSEKY